MAETIGRLHGPIAAVARLNGGVYKSPGAHYAISIGFREVDDPRRSERTVVWVDNPGALLVIAAEFERIADVCRGRYEEEQDRREAAVEAVADGLRAHMSDAVAGDETVPHEDTSATGHLVAAEAGGA